MACLSLIAAVAQNGVIGRDNALPWRLPGDLGYFKRVTMGKPIVMGRKTFASIGRPLPGRSNIVVSRDPGFRAPGCRTVASLQAALELASELAGEGAGEVLVIGGSQVYAATLPSAQRLYLTEVHAQIEGDAFFPPVDWSQWREVSREQHAAEAPNPYAYSFVVYERV